MQKGFGNSPLSFTGCKFCYSSTSLGPFRLQISKWKIDISLSFHLSPEDPEFGDGLSHVHNVLISTITILSFVRDVDLEKDPVVVDNTQDLLRIDIKEIEDRISELGKIRSNKPYEKQKSSTHRELVRFLASLPTPKSLSSSSPRDILKFLVWKDKSGRTTVHQMSCPQASQT